MKRYGNLFDSLVSFENLYHASLKARRGKRMKEGCATFEMNREAELWATDSPLPTRNDGKFGNENRWAMNPAHPRWKGAV